MKTTLEEFPVIGLCGPKGVGKTTAAARLLERHKFMTRDFFAAPLKNMLVEFLQGFGLTRAQAWAAVSDPVQKEQVIPAIGRSPRTLMQTLGTEWGRDCVGSDVWTNAFTARLPPPGSGKTVLVDDVRFQNEAAVIRARGGLVLAVHRPGFKPAADAHVTEQGLPEDCIDGYLRFGPTGTGFTMVMRGSTHVFYNALDQFVL